MPLASSGLIGGDARGHPSSIATATSFSASLADLPLPVALLLLSMLLPAELDFGFGGMRLSCQRIVVLAFLPIAITHLLTGRGPKLRYFDFLFVGAIAYYAFAIFCKEPLDKALQSGGIVFVETVGGYLLARSYVRNTQQFLATTRLLFVMVLITGALAIPESLLSDHFARNIAAAISGAPPVTWKEDRMGLLRAMSVFDHPIHYGAFCAIVFGLVWFAEPDARKRLFSASLVGGAAFFSLSAGPLQGIALVLAGACWERATRHVPNRVWLTIVAVALLYLLASLVTTRSPFEALTSRLVLDSGSYWYRRMIWDYGVANVLNSPWIGVPLGTWERPDWMASGSVDNHWLALAMWGGVPSVVFLFLSIFVLLRAVHSRVVIAQSPGLRCSRYSWTATVLAFCVMGATVQYWGTLGVLFTFCLGLGGWLTEAQQSCSLLPSKQDGRTPRLAVEARVAGLVLPFRRELGPTDPKA